MSFHHVASRRSAALHLLNLHGKVSQDPLARYLVRVEIGESVNQLEINSSNVDTLRSIAFKAQRGLVCSFAHKPVHDSTALWHRVDVALID